MNGTNTAHEPIADSPWFWVYLFATVALAMLLLMRTKIERRQASLDRQHVAREIAISAPPASATVQASPDSAGPLIPLDYLVAVLGVLVCGGWCRLWYTRFRARGLNSKTPE